MNKGREPLVNEKTFSWIKTSLGMDAEVISTSVLYGGVSAAIKIVAVTVGGSAKEVVIKQYTNKSWLLEEPNLAQNEMENLQFILNKYGPTPVPIAVDTDGHKTGHPSVLMEKLDGDVVLEPKNFTSWTRALASTLAMIHSVDATEFPRAFSTYTSKEEVMVPTWGSAVKQWEQAIAIVRGVQPSTKQTFIHRDYHPTNVLWRDGNVTGVVDWVNACRGPANVDVGHCRVNLALLHGVEVADQFLEAYLYVASSKFDYDPYWDLLAVFDFIDRIMPLTVYEGWIALGVTELTNEMMHERMEHYLSSIIERID